MALQTMIRGSSPGKNSLEIFAARLLDKIMLAPAGAAVARYIKVALNALHSRKLNGYIIQRFIDRVTLYLDRHVAADPQEAANTKLAKEQLQGCRREIARSGISESPALPLSDDLIYE